MAKPIDTRGGGECGREAAGEPDGLRVSAAGGGGQAALAVYHPLVSVA